MLVIAGQVLVLIGFTKSGISFFTVLDKRGTLQQVMTFRKQRKKREARLGSSDCCTGSEIPSSSRCSSPTPICLTLFSLPCYTHKQYMKSAEPLFNAHGKLWQRNSQFGSQAIQILQVEGCLHTINNKANKMRGLSAVISGFSGMLRIYCHHTLKFIINGEEARDVCLKVSKGYLSLQGTTRLPFTCYVFFTQGRQVHGLAVELAVLG